MASQGQCATGCTSPLQPSQHPSIPMSFTCLQEVQPRPPGKGHCLQWRWAQLSLNERAHTCMAQGPEGCLLLFVPLVSSGAHTLRMVPCRALGVHTPVGRHPHLLQEHEGTCCTA